MKTEKTGSEQRRNDRIAQVRVPRHLWRLARHVGADRDMTVRAVVAEALKHGLEELGRKGGATRWGSRG